MSTSNIDEISAAFDDLFDSFGFTAEATGGINLGEECVGLIIESIADDASQAKGADGQTFPDNSEPYRADKDRVYGWDNPGYRTGQTLSLASLKGTPEISDDQVSMTYGTGEPPSRSYSPTGHISDQDKEVTDREKAGWLTEKYGDIYALNEARERAVVDAVSDAFGKFATDKFSGGA